MSRRRTTIGLISVLLALAFAAPAGAATREHWIAAEPASWNVVPNGRDAIARERFARADTRLDAVVYRAYTRGWRRPLRKPGIPGPLLRARVGDTILVHFKNRDSARPHSMHFHGVHYPFSSDGSFLPGFSGRGANVRPGRTFTYRLRAGRDSAGVWPYHDHGPAMGPSLEGGMYGALSILGRDQRPPDRELVVFLGSHLGFETINGRAYVGNTPVFHARVGEVVQWDVLALGDGHHTFHIHGHRWRDAAGVPVDTRTIGPAESFSLRYREDRPGAWLYHCHVEEHMMRGMIGLYRVRR